MVLGSVPQSKPILLRFGAVVTAIPGLIDAHTHMTYFWDGAAGTTPLSQPRREPAQLVELAAANARKTLETGVTTVRDLGASRGTDYTMRDLIAAGKMSGPRMIAAELGALAPGYFADIVAVDGDPLKDIDVVINKVRWVMAGGR